MRVHHWLMLMAFLSLCFAVWRLESRLNQLENERRIFNWPSRADVRVMIQNELDEEGYDALIQQLQNITLDHEKRIERDCVKHVSKMLAGVDLATRRKVYDAIRDAAKIGQYAERDRAIAIVGRNSDAWRKIVALSCDEVLELENVERLANEPNRRISERAC